MMEETIVNEHLFQVVSVNHTRSMLPMLNERLDNDAVFV
jgi:hypothetical protein